MDREIIVTGSAGFIGYHLCKQLLMQGINVIGVDCITNYYDVDLKENRLAQLVNFSNYRHVRDRIENLKTASLRIDKKNPILVHLAAQAGVRYSIDQPKEYAETNLMGTFNVLEIARELELSHLLIASTSSVYGNTNDFPLSETFHTSKPLSFYSATKKSTEVMAYSYSSLFEIPTTILRFFTVYGPWGRPDMALFKFTKAMLSGEAIDVYNYGDMKRDFTYVEDLVRAIVLIIKQPPSAGAFGFPKDNIPYRILNIGNSKPERLIDFISALEESLEVKAIKNLMPMQDGDVKETWCDSQALLDLTGYQPNTDIKTGVQKFVDWYIEYFE